MFIDIHCHASDAGTAHQVVRNLFHDQAGEMKSGKFYSIGLHPWHVSKISVLQDIEMMKIIALQPEIIAIGETGLDKSIKIPFDLQLQAFQMQIRIAEEVNKPMIIHCVRSYNEVFEFKLKSSNQKPWVIHWFNASREMGLQLIEKGFYLSFGHMLFQEKSKAFKAFQHLPLENIFFETDDAGYNIDVIYNRAAELLSIELSELEVRIEKNFINFFGIKP